MDMSSPKTPFRFRDSDEVGMSSPKTLLTDSEECSHTIVNPSPADNASQVIEEVLGDHIVAVEDDNPMPQMGDLPEYDMHEENIDPEILQKMRSVAAGVISVGIGGNYAFLQVSRKNLPNHLLKCMYSASNISLGVSALTAIFVVLIIYINSPESSRSIKKLKYALRVAILLVIIGYVLFVAFNLLH